MYITTSHYRVKLDHADRPLRLLEQQLLPLLRNVRGFVSYQVVVTGSQAFQSIGAFASKDAVETGNEVAARWLIGQPPDLFEGAPKVATGEVRLVATADRTLDAAGAALAVVAQADRDQIPV